jgi:ribosomal protein S18 acetylase RimI-like enzyme
LDVDVTRVSEVDRPRAIGTLVLAFTADPFVRWIYPQAAQYLTQFPRALQAFGGIAFGHEGVWQLRDFAAVALWLPPGVEPDGDATVSLFKATVDSRKFDDLLGVFAQMEEAHPATQLWYLPWFGVDCAVQGQGLGSQLLTPCLEIVDREHLPAYLDSTNPRNIPFYQRHGFEVTGQWQAGDSPPIISMLREPR